MHRFTVFVPNHQCSLIISYTVFSANVWSLRVRVRCTYLKQNRTLCLWKMQAFCQFVIQLKSMNHHAYLSSTCFIIILYYTFLSSSLCLFHQTFMYWFQGVGDLCLALDLLHTYILPSPPPLHATYYTERDDRSATTVWLVPGGSQVIKF